MERNGGKYFFPIKLSVDVSAKIIHFFSGHILSYHLLLLNNKAEKMDSSDCYLITKQKKWIDCGQKK